MKNWKEWIGRIIIELVILVLVGLWTLSISSKLKDYEATEHAEKTYVKKEMYLQDQEYNRRDHAEIKELLKEIRQHQK